VNHFLTSLQELSRKTSECGRLQEKSLALAKELAAVKLYAIFYLKVTVTCENQLYCSLKMTLFLCIVR
jgi:hypothetical protein